MATLEQVKSLQAMRCTADPHRHKIHIDNIDALLAGRSTDALLMGFCVCDSIEWMLHRIMTVIFAPHLTEWSIRSSTHKREAYTWTSQGREWEVYAKLQQREWWLRIKPHKTYQQLMEDTPPDIGPAFKLVLFLPHKCRSLQMIIMENTTYIAERDISETDVRQQQILYRRQAMIVALSNCLRQTRTPKESGTHHLIPDRDVRDRLRLFQGIATVLSPTCCHQLSHWLPDCTFYTWESHTDAIAYTFLKLEDGDWALHYEKLK